MTICYSDNWRYFVYKTEEKFCAEFTNVVTGDTLVAKCIFVFKYLANTD